MAQINRLILCLFCASQVATLSNTKNRDKTKLNILWLFGLDGSPHAWGRIAIGRLAVQDINATPNLLENYELVALERPTTISRADLDVKRTLGILIDAIYGASNKSAPQLIMSTCPPYTPEATAVAHFTPNYNLITVAGLSTSPALSDKTAFPLFFRTSMSAGDFKYSVLSVLQMFDWRQIVGIYMDDPFAVDTAGELERHLEANGIVVEKRTIFKLNSSDDAPLAKLLAKSTSRIILSVANGDQARYAICQLYQNLEATGADYVWLFIGISVAEFQRPQPYDTQNCTLNDMQRAINGSFWFDYGGLDARDLPMLTGYRPTELRRRVVEYLHVHFSNVTDKTILDMAFREYDAFLAIAAALNNSIAVLESQHLKLEQFNYSRAVMMKVFKHQLLSLQNVQGAAGPITFQANGDRPATVTLRQFQATHTSCNSNQYKNCNNSQELPVAGWVTVATTQQGAEGSAALNFSQQHNALLFGTASGQAPIGYKSTSFFNSTRNIEIFILSVIIACGIIIATIVASYYIRKRTLQNAQRQKKWLLDGNDVTVIEPPSKSALSIYSKTVSIATSAHSSFIGNFTATGARPLATNLDDILANGFCVANYQQAKVVCLFPLDITQTQTKMSDTRASHNFMGSIALNRQFIQQTKLFNNCAHDNLAKFVGILIKGEQSENLSVVGFEFCLYAWQNKGTLRDVLDMEHFQLDPGFKLLTKLDITLGLLYLHKTFGYHGRLRSSNIFVDNRFCCKISDYGYNGYRTNFLLNAPNHLLLWTAPELLQLIALKSTDTLAAFYANKTAMQKADIFSLNVVVYEIITRLYPYETTKSNRPDRHTGHAEEILNNIIVAHNSGEAFLIKCILEAKSLEGGGEFPPIALKIFKQNCAPDASQRPSLQDIIDLAHRTGKAMGWELNIMDHLLHRIEKYEENLEMLIQEKTQALFDEKARAETLLYNILPRTVADQLKAGKAVEPESFDSVSIYFSDVVGFTNLSAESTPLQDVDLLNDLYNMFDNIIADYDVYKVETIGDAYMVVSGLPLRNGVEHARHIARMAQKLVHCMTFQFRVRHMPDARLSLRVGLHMGPCAAGVVGFVMPRYCLFGDTVNTASRMESTGEPMRIHVSDSMHELLQSFLNPETKLNEFSFELRGDTVVKGKGTMRTYWLLPEKNSE